MAIEGFNLNIDRSAAPVSSDEEQKPDRLNLNVSADRATIARIERGIREVLAKADNA